MKDITTNGFRDFDLEISILGFESLFVLVLRERFIMGISFSRILFSFFFWILLLLPSCFPYRWLLLTFYMPLEHLYLIYKTLLRFSSFVVCEI